jgi:uncharacterized protein with HEPN domain
MNGNYLVYVYHILESLHAINEFTDNHNSDSLAKDRMCWDAVLRNLQTIADSTKFIPQQIKDKYDNIPWNDIVGFRNILVHEYLEGLDKNIVWQVITSDILDLKKAMLDICPNWKPLDPIQQ